MTDPTIGRSNNGKLHLSAGTRAHICNARNGSFYCRPITDADFIGADMSQCCSKCASVERWRGLLTEASKRVQAKASAPVEPEDANWP